MRPTVIIPDTSPLIHLAAAGALTVPNQLGRVVVVDVVMLEATHGADRPYARDIAAWIAAGQEAGSNQPIDIAETELGSLFPVSAITHLKPERT